MTRHEPEKSWVMVAIGASRQVEAWRTYEGMIWGSPAYIVLGFYDGRHAHAVAEGRRIERYEEEEERLAWMASADNYGEAPE